ncbi:MAG TPA: S8 family serine peptidase [Verrucomicrobiae bacterium]|nr:S8 family serine peptidase [Verrucomicrobiae bacterium]
MQEAWHRGLALICLWLSLSFSSAAAATSTNTLVWNKAKDRVDADVRGWELFSLLERIAGETGWQIFLDPEASHTASVKFKNLPSGQALRQLLGNLNYALVPETNDAPHLYVFRTSMDQATQLVGGAPAKARPKARRVPNELIVRLKPGASIDALARLLGAKVIGRIPELDAYRLQFEDEAATEAARAQLTANPEVVSVQDNYYVDPPPSPLEVTGVSALPPQLKLNPPAAERCKVVVGFVDTGVQPMGSELESILTRYSVNGESSLSTSEPLHGTAMLSAAAQVVATAEKNGTSLRFVSVNVFGTNRTADTFSVATGLITAGNKGATVINASLGGYGDSPILRDAVQQLYSHNIPVFAAVGNDASTEQFYPAAYPQVISVTALERGKLAAYANVGTQPDVAAPGTVLFPFNGQTYVARGTSVSTAVATGLAAGLADANCAPWSQVIPAVERNLAVPSASVP